jgi:hypothetical protein
MDTQDLKTGIALIRKDFNLEASELSFEETTLSADILLDRLDKLVAYLLEKDFSRLLQILYRIDIPEEKLRQALASNKGEPSTMIARLILERELQKVETRKRYSS